MIISFAWTTEALLMEAKTRTRRHWKTNYAIRFHKDSIHQAWSRSPRVKGALHLGFVRLTAEPFPQLTSYMTPEDFTLEGLRYMSEKGQLINGIDPIIFFNRWVEANELVWVIDFRILMLTPAGIEMKKRMEGRNERNVSA